MTVSVLCLSYLLCMWVYMYYTFRYFFRDAFLYKCFMYLARQILTLCQGNIALSSHPQRLCRLGSWEVLWWVPSVTGQRSYSQVYAEAVLDIILKKLCDPTCSPLSCREEPLAWTMAPTCRKTVLNWRRQGNVEKKARCDSVMLMFRSFYEGFGCFRRYVLWSKTFSLNQAWMTFLGHLRKW